MRLQRLSHDSMESRPSFFSATILTQYLLRSAIMPQIFPEAFVEDFWGFLIAFSWLYVLTGGALYMSLDFGVHSLSDKFKIFLGCVVISLLIWILVVFLIFQLYLAISQAISQASDQVKRVSSYLRCRYILFWENWTIRSRRLGWKTLPGFSTSETPLLSDTACLHDCQTTSRLCQGCYEIIQQSNLISGSWFLFTKRVEWYKWTVPVQGSEFRISRKSCQLCHVIWHSLDEQQKLRLAGPFAPRRQHPDTPPWLWLSIWEDENDHRARTRRLYLALLGYHGLRPENCHISSKLSDELELREEPLNGTAPSVHIPTRTSECIELAKTWITNCQRDHGDHCTREQRKAPDQYLPARLLSCGDGTSSSLRLVETCSPHFDLADGKYLALSYHRSRERLFGLTLEKKHIWKSAINEAELPLTFKHAIELTRKLEIKYLWVDVLCVVQDCEEELELLPKSTGKVFLNAYCTIASPSGSDRGIFYSRPSSLLDFSCNLRFSKKKAMTVRAKSDTYNAGSFAQEVDNSALAWQSWGFQERLLSRRIIHFGPRFLFFECNSHIASEAMVAGQPFLVSRSIMQRPLASNFPTVFNPVNGYREAFRVLCESHTGTLSRGLEIYLSNRWSNIVYKFTRCRAISSADRVDAIQGLVQGIQASCGEREYMHGLWRRHLLLDLLWFVEAGQAKKQSDHRTRSWSWQSVSGEISKRLMRDQNEHAKKGCTWSKVAELMTEEVVESTGGAGTEVPDHLTLRCPLYPCTAVFPCRNQQFVLQLHTPEGRIEARCIPDILNFDRDNLIAAEIIRKIFYEDSKSKKDRKEVTAIWSNGIVLQRRYVDEGQGLRPLYERVGMFWMQWPLVVDRDDLRMGNRASAILGYTKGHVVRIE